VTDAVVARGLVKHYGEVKALDGVDVTVPTGSVLGFLGPNGAGKTTAVRILATLLTPDSGTAEVAGVDVLENPPGRFGDGSASPGSTRQLTSTSPVSRTST